MIPRKKDDDDEERKENEKDNIIKESNLCRLLEDLLVLVIQFLDLNSIRAFSLANTDFRKLVEERGLLGSSPQ